jgi:hypothetical protein
MKKLSLTMAYGLLGMTLATAPSWGESETDVEVDQDEDETEIDAEHESDSSSSGAGVEIGSPRPRAGSRVETGRTRVETQESSPRTETYRKEERTTEEIREGVPY